MPGPWEKYQTGGEAPAEGPWSNYAGQPAPASPPRGEISIPAPEGVREPGFMDRLNAIAGSMPQSYVARQAAEGMKKANEAFSHVAYQAGDKASELAHSSGLSPEVSGLIGLTTNVGLQAIPTFATGVSGKLATPTFEHGANRLMSMALGQRAAAQPGGAKAVKTMLDEGVSVTQGGVEKVRGLLDNLDDELSKVIQNSTKNIDTHKAAMEVKGLLNKVTRGMDAKADASIIAERMQTFLDHPLVQQTLPIQTAQMLKRGFMSRIRETGGYNANRTQIVEKEADKAITSGLRKEIAAAEPAVVPLNERMGSLANVQEFLEPRVAQTASRIPGGLSYLASHLYPALGYIGAHSPPVLSGLARTLYAGREAIPVNAARAMGVVPAGVSALSPEGNENQDSRTEILKSILGTNATTP